MCSHYQAIRERERYIRAFGVEPPAEPGKVELWPGYMGSFIRRHPYADVGDESVPVTAPTSEYLTRTYADVGDESVPVTEAVSGMFGLVPHWATDTKIARQTYNARSETVAEKPSFRDAWKRAQHCIIPAVAIYEPDWRSGKAVATRIERADGEPMGIAGLWASWKSPKGEMLHSYTMLTINADGHDLMQRFHKPTDERRMVVVLAPERYQDWLEARSEQSTAFMRPLSADTLVASADRPIAGLAP